MMRVIFLLGMAILCEVAFCNSNREAKNLVLNPNFEEVTPDGTPLNWRGSAKIYSQSTSVVHPPAVASLSYHNQDPKTYALFDQTIVGAVAGRTYYFSAAIKTVGLTSTSPGGSATICVQWSKNGTWAGGNFPTGLIGTSNWETISSIFLLPSDADASSLSVSVYVRASSVSNPTPVGLAYFDNVTLMDKPVPPMNSVLLSPVYRGRVTAGDANPIALRAHLWFETETTIVVVTTINPKPSGDGESQSRQEIARQETLPQHVGAFTKVEMDTVFTDFDARKTLAPGEYVAITMCIDVSGTHNVTLTTQHHNLTRMDDADPTPKVFIDEFKRTLVDGQPFFPMGVYYSVGGMSTASASFLNISKSPFNFVMPYGIANQTNLDAAHTLNLKVAYSLKDIFYGSKFCPKSVTSPAEEEALFRSLVHKFKSHPAIIAWYTNDELAAATFGKQLLAHQSWLIKDDIDHPSWQVLCEDGLFDEYMGTFDIIGSDPYPIGSGNKTAAGVHEEVNNTVTQTDFARPVWEVIQAHNWENYHKGAHCPTCRTPSYMEERSMAWQAINAGANGIIFYSYRDIQENPDMNFDTQWAHLHDVATEILSFAPVLLSNSGQAHALPTTTLGVSAAPTPWLMTRAHWIGQDTTTNKNTNTRTNTNTNANTNANTNTNTTNTRSYTLFVVSDGSVGGEGSVIFDFSNFTDFACSATNGFTVQRIMQPNPNEAPPAHPPQKTHACVFTDTVPLLAAMAYNITFA